MQCPGPPPLPPGQELPAAQHLSGELAHTDWWEPGIQVPVGKGATRAVFRLVTTLAHSAAHGTHPAAVETQRLLATALPEGTLLAEALIALAVSLRCGSSETGPESLPRWA